MNNLISTLRSRRNELALELGRIDKAIAIQSNTQRRLRCAA
jgi:hypothetical protein